MNSLEKKIAFYEAMLAILGRKQFLRSLAKSAVKLYEEAEGLSINESVTLEYVEKVHYAQNKSGGDFYAFKDLAEAAFRDLCKYLRVPRVSVIIDEFSKMIDPDLEDLFACTMNVRYLGDDADGPAVVTLVVLNHKQFRRFMQDRGSVTEVRYWDRSKKK